MKSHGLSDAIFALLYLTALCACVIGIRQSLKSVPAPTAIMKKVPGCLPSSDGYLRARLRGASDVDIDWHNADMQCDGGPRPDDSGVRVTFVGRVPGDGRQIRLVFGMVTNPQTSSARNVPTNVTVIFEDEQKLYSTAGAGKCTIDELALQSSPMQDAKPWRRAQARGFCTSPATAIAGGDSLLLDRFDFAGVVRDSDQD